jgi:hypothetical protein
LGVTECEVFGGSGGLNNTEELKDHRADTKVYLDSGYQGPTSSSLRIFVLKSIQIWGLQMSVRESFGRGSLGVDPRLIGGEVSSLLKGRKTMERVEEPLVLLSGWLCSRCRA